MKNDIDKLTRMLYRLDSGYNELLSYMGEELFSTGHKEVEGHEPPASVISVYDASFLEKPRIILAINNAVGRLNEQDIAIIKSCDELSNYISAFADGDKVEKHKILGIRLDLMSEVVSEETKEAVNPDRIRSTLARLETQLLIDDDMIVLKAEILAFKLDRLLERYFD